MNSLVRNLLQLGVTTLCALLSACATTPSEQSSGSEQTASAQAPETVAAEPAVPGLLDAVMQERRRGDYPEVETDTWGFTITEQVRIAGNAYGAYERALELLRAERWDEAIAALLQITGTEPELTAPWIDLGIAYGRSGDLEQAAEALETAVLLAPAHPIAHNELGIIHRRAGRFAQARAEYEKALAVFADFHFARRNLAVLCDLYLADTECALQNYQMYLDSVDADPEVEIWVADLAARSGQDL